MIYAHKKNNCKDPTCTLHHEDNVTQHAIEADGAAHDAVVKAAVNNYVAEMQKLRKKYIADMEAAWTVCYKQMQQVYNNSQYVARTYKEKP